MPVYDEILRDLRARTPEISVDGLVAEAQRVILIDCREPDEHAAGAIAGAQWIPRGFLEAKVEKLVGDRAAPVVVYCASGNRSLFAQRSLAELGYTNVRSLAGGFSGWKKAGQPWETPKTLRADQDVRYSRHVLLPEVGLAGQTKLLASKVVCIGAGGLGSPSSMYLAAAGVGTLGMIDDDTVDVSNLQRQILHGTDRLGIAKVDSAERTLKNLNPDVRVEKHRVRLSSQNALELLAPYDVIVDGADNFATRYLVNDVALRLGKPVVHASIFRFEGQLTVFSATGGPCYRCLYPQPPPPEDAPSCAEGGVLGVLPGTMGALQATEAIKLLLGIGETLAGRLLVYDALKARFREMKLRRDPTCPTCGDGVDRPAIQLVDYDQFCSAR
ncbi:MAG TPA: molybdopterin-synthase adenylyltransferase MoeB [Kofleriaceae bacterium]|jgi:molybdopterin/thiamine biosynthesis adenylyltransferase/rhodanese-related sulfurtransferase|nr:molybdopterin-synthase adenylyltransferase MoeB [Kofleriaceae bacterium]